MTKIFLMDSGNNIIIIAFTNKAVKLALTLANKFNFRVFVPERFIELDSRLSLIDESLSEWTGKYFNNSRALIFISAAGIAVRAISKHVTSKLHDPAVIVIDESGKFIIPILSGHIGGANELARKIAAFLNSIPVITTATDINNIIAIDEWAVNNNCVIENPDSIKKISGALLENKSIGAAISDLSQKIPFSVNSQPDKSSLQDNSMGIMISNLSQITPFSVTLFLRPKNLILGAGCNSGVDPSEFESAVKIFLEDSGVSILSLKAIASIDIKANEPAFIKFAENHNIPFLTYKAHDLQALPGIFTSSQRVLQVTGTDNICERSCIMAAGSEGVLLRNKFVYKNCITLALARDKRENYN
ncbi:MAG: cobalt-precorrin 5A hydrolase [Synergistaceae bacterium]|nr:cobalt-precorrin 5A hydrolase [Synergistaceae bacterium]